MTHLCQECDKQYKSKATLQRHVKDIHHGVKYDCPKCDKQYSSTGGLHLHNKAVHENVAYICNICNYSSFYRSEYKKHQSIEHLEIRFECFTCDLGIGINSVRIRIIRAIKKTIFKLNSTTGDPEKLNFGNSLSADRFKSQSLDQSWSRSRTCAYQKRFQFGIGVILVLKNTILDTGTD